MLRYSYYPGITVRNEIESQAKVYFNEEEKNFYFSIESCLDMLNECYEGPEKEPLKKVT